MFNKSRLTKLTIRETPATTAFWERAQSFGRKLRSLTLEQISQIDSKYMKDFPILSHLKIIKAGNVKYISKVLSDIKPGQLLKFEIEDTGTPLFDLTMIVMQLCKT